MSKKLAKKVLLIGWDAANWKVIHPLMDSGKMPALEKLINTGVMGNLATLDPPDENVKKSIARTVNESKFYLARVFMHSRKMKDALPRLADLYENLRDEQRYALRLAQCYVELTRTADAKKIVDETVKKLKKQIRF